MLNVSVTAMYAATSDATDGVVLFEEIDPSYGHYAARARHRKIAAVVWERCAEPGEREEIILGALSRLNLNYRTDVKAFEDFIRSDRLVDSIRTLDARIRFFEQACQKDPSSPYVRQHYARMLARAGQFNLALGQIDEGLKLNTHIRVLHHTKGMILSQLAMTTESREIGRRHLLQSEEEFRHCLKANNKDEYAYQGLATLYVDWAERTDDAAEAADYLARAEAIINEELGMYECGTDYGSYRPESKAYLAIPQSIWMLLSKPRVAHPPVLLQNICSGGLIVKPAILRMQSKY